MKASRAAERLLLRSLVCEAVRFFDHWVNGEDLRLTQLAAGRLPAYAPAPVLPAPIEATPDEELALARYDGAPCALPALDPEALSPIKHVLLHGSMATQDSCEFSDVDVAVFVDDSSTHTPQQCARAVGELRRLLDAVLAFDPLMHHGLMFAPASVLGAYKQRFLPVDALAKARVLHGPRTLRLRRARASLEERRRSLAACVRSLRAHVAARDFLENDYRLKNFLAGALLLPARVLAARGTYVYKRESFALAQNLFSREEWEFIARCEGLRALWKRPPAAFAQRLVRGGMHPRMRHVVGVRMAPRLNVRRLSPLMVDGLVRSANRFLDSGEFAV